MTCRKIAILVEAGKSIGGGHLQRMKCLASQQEIDCQAILTQTPEQVAPICRNRSLLSGAYSAQLSALVHQHPDVEVLVIDPPYSAEDPSYRDGDNWHEFIVKANQHGLISMPRINPLLYRPVRHHLFQKKKISACFSG